MKKKILIVSICFIFAAVIIITLIGNKKEIDSRKEVKIIQHNIAVNIADVEVRPTLGKLQFVGTTEPNRDVMVAAESSGKITKVNFKLGDYVNEGTILATIDDTFRRLAYENAKLNYDKFKDDLARFKNLKKGDAISETQLRDMQMGYDNAKIQLEQAKKSLDDTKITAPFSGYITSKSTELGA
jgi:RND family efflux transporter MFP subunit